MHPLRWLRRMITLERWNKNPFQMWMLVFLMQVSANQLLIATSTMGALAEQPRDAQVSLAACNLLGGIIVFVALHLREKVLGKWVELCGYIALTGSMGIYTWLVLRVSMPPNTSFGLGLSEAFVVASMHRWILLVAEKVRAEIRYRNREKVYRTRLRKALDEAGIPVKDEE